MWTFSVCRSVRVDITCPPLLLSIFDLPSLAIIPYFLSLCTCMRSSNILLSTCQSHMTFSNVCVPIFNVCAPFFNFSLIWLSVMSVLLSSMSYMTFSNSCAPIFQQCLQQCLSLSFSNSCAPIFQQCLCSNACVPIFQQCLSLSSMPVSHDFQQCLCRYHQYLHQVYYIFFIPFWHTTNLPCFISPVGEFSSQKLSKELWSGNWWTFFWYKVHFYSLLRCVYL